MNLRQKNIEKLKEDTFDVVILGGGINGAVSAAALAAKGVKVALIDRGDFAGETSSNSSNLAWGGIKYLESHEYFLVNRLCKSRNFLLRNYPSSVKEIRFLTSIQKGFRFSSWFIYLGSLVYWVLGRFFTRPPRYLSPKNLKAREKIIDVDNVAGGIEYSDAYFYDNDARFVFNFIRASMDSGVAAANYVESIKTTKEDDLWQAEVKDHIDQSTFRIRARVLINACGPYVDEQNQVSGEKTSHHHLFSKGVHLIVDRLIEQQRVLAFFASDGRLFFVIPMGSKTCIGTTDNQVSSPGVEVTDEDRQFILDNVNHFLALDQPLTGRDIISERCGVRPLASEGDKGVADWVKLSRKHVIELNKTTRHLSIFGGKLTDCINVGEEVIEQVSALGIAISSKRVRWYGEPNARVKESFFQQAKLSGLDSEVLPVTSEAISVRLWRRYGASAMDMLEAIRRDPGQKERLIKNSDCLRCEIEYMAKHEMVTKLDDFLRRRSKISQVIRHQELMETPGLLKVCEILFGDQAEVKLQEYLGS